MAAQPVISPRYKTIENMLVAIAGGKIATDDVFNPRSQRVWRALQAISFEDRKTLEEMGLDYSRLADNLDRMIRQESNHGSSWPDYITKHWLHSHKYWTI